MTVSAWMSISVHQTSHEICWTRLANTGHREQNYTLTCVKHYLVVESVVGKKEKYLKQWEIITVLVRVSSSDLAFTTIINLENQTLLLSGKVFHPQIQLIKKSFSGDRVIERTRDRDAVLTLLWASLKLFGILRPSSACIKHLHALWVGEQDSVSLRLSFFMLEQKSWVVLCYEALAFY